MNGREFRYNYKDYRDGIIDTKYRKKRKGVEQNLRGRNLMKSMSISRNNKFYVSAYNSIFSRYIAMKYNRYVFSSK